MNLDNIKDEIMVYVCSPIGRYCTTRFNCTTGKEETVLSDLPKPQPYLVAFMDTGHLEDPWSIPLGATRAAVYSTEVAKMAARMAMLRKSLVKVEGAGDEDVWRLLLRGAVACRMSAAPGGKHLQRYSAVTGLAVVSSSSKARPKRIWAPLSTRAGLVDALIGLLHRLRDPDLVPYTAAVIALSSKSVHAGI